MNRIIAGVAGLVGGGLHGAIEGGLGARSKKSEDGIQIFTVLCLLNSVFSVYAAFGGTVRPKIIFPAAF